MKIPADLHVLLPAYNEGPVIGEVIVRLKEAGVSHIVVVDDGSEDDTATEARRAGATVVCHLVNRGAGAAVQTGIELARREGWPFLALMDADGQHLAADLPRLMKIMRETEADLVIGSRFLETPEGMPRDRRFYNGIANFLTNRLTKKNYSDSQSGLRLLNARAIERLQLQVDGFGFCSEMVVLAERAGLKVEETPTSVIYTKYSTSKGQDFHVGVKTAINFLWNTLFK
ncbi:MAG: glycosyltransferase family 2 protein [Bacteroidota bacterium]